MKKLNFLFFSLAMIFASFLLGCKKELEGLPQVKVEPKVYLPIKIINKDFTITYSYLKNTGILAGLSTKIDTDVVTYQISYNTLNQPKKGTWCDNGVVFKEIRYSLNARGDVISGKAFEVKNGIAGEMISFYSLTYDNLNRLTHINYYKADGQLDKEDSFEYSSESIITKLTTAGKTSDLEYDNFKGMATSVENAPLFYLEFGDYTMFSNKNNLTKLPGSTRTYKYNEDKYPVEMVININNVNLDFKIEYDVK